jgi:Lanthionine synthetase C-like protein
MYQPDRHEPLAPLAWSESEARDAIASIVRETRERFAGEGYWPLHRQDTEPGDAPDEPMFPLYFGAAGTIWALRYLQDGGIVERADTFEAELDTVMVRNRRWLAAAGLGNESASLLMGDTPVLLMAHGARPAAALADRLQTLLEGNVDHPARELMWGAPGTMLATLFLHERFQEERWASIYRQTAARLWSQLEWSERFDCHYWTQELYGQRTTYLDAVHGFVATAFVLIRGRHLLPAVEWAKWESAIATTVARTATREDTLVNWRTQLVEPRTDRPYLMQFCHGAPGFAICLADFPSDELDALLIGAGEATWRAGPLVKGSNLCHGTGGNGYAFLKLFARTGDSRWLERARAFAMHGIRQTWAARERYGRLRYSLWTGDLGFAVYLWDCIRGAAAYPTLDAFWASQR